MATVSTRTLSVKAAGTLTPRSAAEEFHQGGLSPVPLRPRSKVPAFRGWQSHRFDPLDFRQRNIGLRTGLQFNVCVLDFDFPTAFALAVHHNPDLIDGRYQIVQSSRGWHLYFKPRPIEPSRKLKGIDILGEGRMSVAPPSVH